MAQELLENLVTLAKTDYRSRLQLKSVEVVKDSKVISPRSNNAVQSSSLKTQLPHYIN